MMKELGTSTPETRSSKGVAPPGRICGIVRPIADMGTYTSKHWRDVHAVVAEAVESIGFTLRLVSESDAAGVILTEIVTNLYEDEIVIVDVSGRNPNVMFELGMRIAFEKPAIIIMDDETPFSFDISPVKHIRYPRTLRYPDVVKFKAEIAGAVEATLNVGQDKKNYLQQFGPIKVTELGSNSIDLSEIVHEVQDIRRLMNSLINRTEIQKNALSMFRDETYLHDHMASSSIVISLSNKFHERFLEYAVKIHAVDAVEEEEGQLQIHLQGHPKDVSDARNSLRALARELELGLV